MFTTHWGEHMEQFEGLDFYDIESLLTEEEIMIRDMVRESLETNGIETRIAFPPIHLQPMFNRNFDSLELPNTCLAFETMLDIPCHAKLKSDDINLIIKIVKESILQ